MNYDRNAVAKNNILIRSCQVHILAADLQDIWYCSVYQFGQLMISKGPGTLFG